MNGNEEHYKLVKEGRNANAGDSAAITRFKAHSPAYNEKVVSAILQDISRLNLSKVTDVGCGDGSLIFCLEGKLGENSHLTGIDLSEGMINLANEYAVERNSNAKFYVRNAINIQDVVNETDVITMFSLMQDIPPSDIPALLNAINSTLSNQGRLYMNVFNRDTFQRMTSTFRNKENKARGNRTDPEHGILYKTYKEGNREFTIPMHTYYLQDVITYLNNAGLEIEEIQTQLSPFSNPIGSFGVDNATDKTVNLVAEMTARYGGYPEANLFIARKIRRGK